MTRRRTINAERLLGRPVRDGGGRIVGRLEEIRVERRNGAWEITEFLLGTGALVERLAITRRLLGRNRPTLVARWNQIDITRPQRPTLTCAVDELRVERPDRQVNNTHENG